MSSTIVGPVRASLQPSWRRSKPLSQNRMARPLAFGACSCYVLLPSVEGLIRFDHAR